MRILQESKRILSHTGLANTKFVRIGGITIPRLLVRSAILTAFALGVILECFICVHNYERGVAKILLPFGVMFTFLTLTSTYTTFILKTNKIGRLMECMQHMVNRSNYARFVIFNRFNLIETFFFSILKEPR